MCPFLLPGRTAALLLMQFATVLISSAAGSSDMPHGSHRSTVLRPRGLKLIFEPH